MSPTTLAVTISLGGVLANLLLLAFYAGRKEQALIHKLEKAVLDVNGLGKKLGRAIAVVIELLPPEKKEGTIRYILNG